MLALRRVCRQVLVVEVVDVLLHLEPELLVQQDGRVVGRHVEGDVLPHAGLKINGQFRCNVNRGSIEDEGSKQAWSDRMAGKLNILGEADRGPFDREVNIKAL